MERVRFYYPSSLLQLLVRVMFLHWMLASGSAFWINRTKRSYPNRRIMFGSNYLTTIHETKPNKDFENGVVARFFQSVPSSSADPVNGADKDNNNNNNLPVNGDVSDVRVQDTYDKSNNNNVQNPFALAFRNVFDGVLAANKGVMETTSIRTKDAVVSSLSSSDVNDPISATSSSSSSSTTNNTTSEQIEDKGYNDNSNNRPVIEETKDVSMISDQEKRKRQVIVEGKQEERQRQMMELAREEIRRQKDAIRKQRAMELKVQIMDEQNKAERYRLEQEMVTVQAQTREQTRRMEEEQQRIQEERNIVQLEKENLAKEKRRLEEEARALQIGQQRVMEFMAQQQQQQQSRNEDMDQLEGEEYSILDEIQRQTEPKITAGVTKEDNQVTEEIYSEEMSQIEVSTTNFWNADNENHVKQVIQQQQQQHQSHDISDDEADPNETFMEKIHLEIVSKEKQTLLDENPVGAYQLQNQFAVEKDDPTQILEDMGIYDKEQEQLTDVPILDHDLEIDHGDGIAQEKEQVDPKAVACQKEEAMVVAEENDTIVIEQNLIGVTEAVYPKADVANIQNEAQIVVEKVEESDEAVAEIHQQSEQVASRVISRTSTVEKEQSRKKEILPFEEAQIDVEEQNFNVADKPKLELEEDADFDEVAKTTIEKKSSLKGEENEGQKETINPKKQTSVTTKKEVSVVTDAMHPLLEDNTRAHEIANTESMHHGESQIALQNELIGNDFDQKSNDVETGFSDDDWLASIEAAQKSIEGSIADLDNYDVNGIDDSTKSNWESAQQRALQLTKAPIYMPEFGENDIDMEAMAEAARKAVEEFEKKRLRDQDQSTNSMRTRFIATERTLSMNYTTMNVAQLKQELLDRGLKNSGSKTELITRLEFDDSILQKRVSEEVKSRSNAETTVSAFTQNSLFEKGMSVTGLSEKHFDNFDEYSAGDPAYDNSETLSKDNVRDYKIKEQTGLPPFFPELIGKDDAFDVDDPLLKDDLNGMLDELNIDFNNLDLEILGRAARAAVDLYESEEPSDEALFEIENEIDSNAPLMLPDLLVDGMLPEILVVEGDSMETSARIPPDYEAMAVSQLKSELKRRGLRVTGKKVALIERLQASDREIREEDDIR